MKTNAVAAERRDRNMRQILARWPSAHPHSKCNGHCHEQSRRVSLRNANCGQCRCNLHSCGEGCRAFYGIGDEVGLCSECPASEFTKLFAVLSTSTLFVARGAVDERSEERRVGKEGEYRW